MKETRHARRNFAGKMM